MKIVKRLNAAFCAVFAVFFAFHAAAAFIYRLSRFCSWVLSALTVVFIIAATLIFVRRKRQTKRMASKIANAALFSALLLTIALYSSASAAMASRAATDKRVPEDAVVIVLGAGLSSKDQTAPSLMLSNRLRVALGYLQLHEGAVVFVSGGQGKNEKISEAQSMRDWLPARGIAESRIILEDRSSSTKENLEFSLEVARSRGIDVSDLAIATDGFHQYRAAALAARLGLNAYSLSSYTSMGLNLFFWTREVAGVVLQVWLKIG